ncbi:hypothetical protein [Halioxenophilus sp. WMMB6]|uniref:hypothetical protein n=1 Tax=Halioxenophilus sp. WMMB6 TaxID=3073815 RepID=UPI00295EF553|nr:hypothetical protein [Halioxenophilus sp. WMMB6]
MNKKTLFQRGHFARWLHKVLYHISFIGGSVLLVACGGGGGGGDGGNDDDGGTTKPCNQWPEFTDLELPGNSEVTAVLVLNECAVVVAGYDSSNYVGQSEGNSRGFIRRLDLNAADEVTEAWVYHLDSAGSDSVQTLQLDENSILFTGYVGAALPGETSYGKKDAVVGRISAAGELIKQSQLGNEYPNIPIRVLQADSGEQLLVGWDDIYIPTNFVDRWENPWLAGISESNDQFTLDWMSNTNTEARDLYSAAALAGNTVLLGRFTGEGSPRGIAVEARSLTGTPLWTLPITPFGYDSITDIQVLDEDYALVMGSTYAQLGDSQFGGADYYLLQVLIATGEVVAASQYGSEQLEWAKKLLLDGDKRWLVGERSEGNFPWEIDITLVAAGAEPISLRRTFGDSTNVTDAALLGDGVLVGGYYRPDEVISAAYLAFINEG